MTHIFLKKQNTIYKRGKLSQISFTLLTFLFLATCKLFILSTRASSVFEFELLDWQRNNLGSSLRYNQGTLKNSNDTQVVTSLVVCLREAFSSQKDGLCAYGNASITITNNNNNLQTGNKLLSIDQVKRSLKLIKEEKETVATATTTTTKQEKEGEEEEEGEKVVLANTNLVRIPFTFRWTKSFTIVLTLFEEHHHHHHQQQQQQQQQTDNLTTTTTTTSGSDETQQQISATPQQTTQSTTGYLFIDRHVVTENEVLPALETSAHKKWTRRYLRSPKTALSYRFRLFCSLNYYGDECATFCRARNDQFGHYNCSPSGIKVCHKGWQGVGCERPVCRTGCNQQHGFCDKPNSCQCKPGWTGPRCDECLTYPGCQNGYCLAPWQCICDRNWGGLLCDQDMDLCTSLAPCKHNATCVNAAPGRYKCQCAPGYAGVACEFKLPLVELTSSSGLLTTTTTSLVNNTCQQQHVNPCQNNATCREINSTIHCDCTPGWSGDRCQWPLAVGQATGEQVLVLEQSSITHRTPPRATAGADEYHLVLTTSGTNRSSSTSSDLWLTTTTVDAAEFNSFKDDATNLSPSPINNNHPQLEMGHLMSGVLFASAAGVLVAALMLAWCCLVALKQHGFSFIQMNIIKHRHDGGGATMISTHNNNNNNNRCLTYEQRAERSGALALALHKVNEKICRSFKATAGGCVSSASPHHLERHIKPDTKLSLENVFQAPPSYEESGAWLVKRSHNNNVDKQRTSEAMNCVNKTSEELLRKEGGVISLVDGNSSNDLVKRKRGALELKLELASKDQQQRHELLWSNSKNTLKQDDNKRQGITHQSNNAHDNQMDLINTASSQPPPTRQLQFNCPKHGLVFTPLNLQMTNSNENKT